MKFIDYIHDLMKHGRCSFTLEHAQKILQKSKGAILASIKHMLVKTEISNPVRGFYVIVPPEYQKLECLPVEYFIPYLMEYLNLKYYVCLLTAALYHGASHQAIQVFQVMVEKPRRPIVCGKMRINFIGNRQLSKTPVQTIANTRCIFTVSTPEGTAMDLLKYPDQSAGFNHISTVMAELCDVINPEKLVELLKQKPLENSWKQRLGYVLELVEKPGLASIVKAYLDKQKRIDYVYMQPVKSRIKNDSYPRNNKWKIIENIKIESDL